MFESTLTSMFAFIFANMFETLFETLGKFQNLFVLDDCMRFQVWWIIWEIKIIVIVYWLWTSISWLSFFSIGLFVYMSHQTVIRVCSNMDRVFRTQLFITIIIVWINIIGIIDNLDVYNFITSILCFSPKTIVENIVGSVIFWDRKYFTNNILATGLEDLWCNLLLILIITPDKSTKLTLLKLYINLAQYTRGYLSTPFMLWNMCIILHECDILMFSTKKCYLVKYAYQDPGLNFLIRYLYKAEWSRTLLTDMINEREQLDHIRSNFLVYVITITRMLSISIFDTTYALTCFINSNSIMFQLMY